MEDHTSVLLHDKWLETIISVKSSGDKKSFTVSIGGHTVVDYMGPFTIDAKLMGGV